MDASPAPGLRRLAGACLRALDALLFPSSCVVCDADAGVAPFCGACRGELIDVGPACPRCALTLGPYEVADRGCSGCRDRPLGFDASLALGPYQGPIRELCVRMKDAHHGWLARWVADLIVEARGETLRTWAETAAGVAPVPLHWWRRWRRRYNQAEALAARLARRLDLRLIRPLRRVKRTPILAGRGRIERAELLRAAFRTRGGWDGRGRDVILVDDVLTTGATCGAAARVLKRAGSGRVLAVVVGRAERRA